MSDEKVIDFVKHVMKTKGEFAFIGCACEAEEGWEVVCAHGGDDSAVVTALVCRSCEASLDVNLGRIEEDAHG